MSPRRHAAAREVQGGAVTRTGDGQGVGLAGRSRGRSGARGGQRRATGITWANAFAEATATGWHFVLPVPERVNAIWRQWNGRTLSSKRHRQDKAIAPARFAGIVPLDGDVAVRLVWVRAQRKGDVDGRIKATLDLLKGVAYWDDAQVAELKIVRVDDGSPARMEVFVWPAATPPLVGRENFDGGEG